MSTFGERLRALREERSLNVPELARRVSVTEGAIRQMESGQTKSASFAVGVRLARALGVSADYLAGEPEPGGPPGVVMLPGAADGEADLPTSVRSALEAMRSELLQQYAALATQVADLAPATREAQPQPARGTRARSA